MKKIFAIVGLLSGLLNSVHAAPYAKTRKIGDYVQISVPVLALAHTVWHKDTQGAQQLALGLYSTQIAVITYKHIFPVPRKLNPNNTQSSISGHTAIPMAAAAYLQQRYGWESAWPAYMLTAFVGYSRVVSKAHRLNEVIGGAVLGQFLGYLLTTPFKDDKVQVVAGLNTVSVVVNF